MIRSLRGTVTEAEPHSVVVEVNGLGYLVGTNTLRSGVAIGDTITLHTYLAVRENALDLYGFTKKDELELFLLLLTIPKIGPKSALQILCQADAPLLTEAIIKKDSTYLHKLSGIGKKTAEAIVQHLHEKILETTTSKTDTTDGLSSAHSDVIDALIALGYSPSEARASVREAGTSTDSGELIKRALQLLTQK